MDLSTFDLAEAEAAPDAALLISATLYLMSCHASQPCPRLAGMVQRHLCALSQSAGAPETLKATCLQLCAKWDRLAASVPCSSPSMLARLVAGSTRTH